MREGLVHRTGARGASEQLDQAEFWPRAVNSQNRVEVEASQHGRLVVGAGLASHPDTPNSIAACPSPPISPSLTADRRRRVSLVIDGCE